MTFVMGSLASLVVGLVLGAWGMRQGNKREIARLQYEKEQARALVNARGHKLLKHMKQAARRRQADRGPSVAV